MEKGESPLLVSCKFRIGCLVLIGVWLLSSCSSTPPQISEAPPPASAESPAPPRQQNITLPAPQTNEVEEALSRVFKGAVVIDTTHRPAFVAADFNGDYSQDIAVVVTPVFEKLPDLNQESPPWILRDPIAPIESTSPRLRIANRETLLAVIHGFGERGWRDSLATQTYLLKHAAGSAMKTRSLAEFTHANKGKSLPRFRGGIIEQVLDGKQGCLYYADATYAWYDPKTFRPEPERRMVHAPPTEAPKK